MIIYSVLITIAFLVALIFALYNKMNVSTLKDLLKIEQDHLKFLNTHIQDYQKSCKEYSVGWQKTLDELNNSNLSSRYNNLLARQGLKGLNYATHFLKPRKQKEMWKIVNDFPSFEEWKKNENNVE